MTVASELGESDERVGATIGLEGDVEEVIEGIVAEAAEDASLVRAGFG
jgi:hypothetical protein